MDTKIHRTTEEVLCAGVNSSVFKWKTEVIRSRCLALSNHQSSPAAALILALLAIDRLTISASSTTPVMLAWLDTAFAHL